MPPRLSPLDAAFLYLETDEGPLHIGGVSLLDGDVTAAAYASRLRERLPAAAPRYLQRLSSAPPGAQHQEWEDDPGFDIAEHVIETRLDPPGHEARLRALAADIFAIRLDRSRPLWELHVIRGVDGGRTALLSKIHHAMVDGVSGVELMDVVFDRTPGGEAVPRPPRPAPPAGAAGSPAVEPDAEADPWSWVLRSATALAGDAAEAAASWRAVVDGALATARALAGAAVHPVSPLPFNRPLTGGRRLGWLTMPLAEVRAIGQACGGTVNDVALAVLADGIGRWLATRHVPTGNRYLRLLVPVNVRRADERGQLGNRVSMIPVEVPFEGEPLARLAYAVSRTSAMKQARVADAVERAVGLGDVLPAWLLAQALPYATSAAFLRWTAPLRAAPWLTANMVCTNVPGPPFPLYGLGHRVVAHYPLVPLGFETGLNCALFTYDGVLHLGLVADAAAFEDLDLLTSCLRSAYNDLHYASAGVGGTPRDAASGAPDAPSHGESHAETPDSARSPGKVRTGARPARRPRAKRS